MVSQTTSVQTAIADSIQINAATPSASTSSFSQELSSAMHSVLGNAASGSQFAISIQPAKGQNSATSQVLASLAAAPSAAPVASSAPTVPANGGLSGTVGNVVGAPPTWAENLQDFENGWSVLNPQQVAFQLANAAGTGGADPTATVPGTSILVGDLNQVQQFALQYALNYGTGGLDMQDFLTKNAGPTASWNLSFNQIQQDSGIQSAVSPSYQALASGIPMSIQAPNEYGSLPAGSGNMDNLPDPAMISYLPQDQQAAAGNTLVAEGVYGASAAAAALSYASA